MLPFENGSGRDEDAYLSEGFSDELRDQLSRVRGLRVVARPSSVAFRGNDESTSTIAKKLSAATIVEGNLQRDGDSLRITVRLIDARTDAQLWSERYDRKSSDLLAVQQEIALAAVKQILPQVDPTELPRPAWQASVAELMLLARNYQQKAVSPEDWDRVVSMYQQAAEANPESALVHARLAQALLYQGNDVESAEREARRALRIDPNLAEGHALLGHLLWVQFRHGSSAELRRAIELNPNDAVAQYYYGEYLSFQSGETENMYKHLNRARDLDPMTLLYTATVASHHAQRGEMRALRELVPIIKDRFPDAGGRFALSRILDTAGQLDEAIAWAMEAKRLDPRHEEVTRDIAERLARLGLDPESSRWSPNRRFESCSGNVATTRSSSACRTWTSMMRMAIRSSIWRLHCRPSVATPKRFPFSNPSDYRTRRWMTTSAERHFCTISRSCSVPCTTLVRPRGRNRWRAGSISSLPDLTTTTTTRSRPGGPDPGGRHAHWPCWASANGH